MIDDVEAPVGGPDHVHQVRHRTLVGEIALEAGDLNSSATQRFADRIERRTFPVRHDECRPGVGELPRVDRADTAGGAGDQDHLAIEVRHELQPFP